MIFKNYQSDFEFFQELRNGQSISAAPFELTYYIPGKEQKLIASFDGVSYTNCRPEGNGIVVVVDYSQVQLGIGSLRCTSRYFLDNSDYPDGTCEPVSDFEVRITLHRGESDEVDSLVATPLPSYHVIRTGGGGGGEIPNGSVTEYKLADDAVSTTKIKDGAVTEDKLSEEVKEKLNQQSGGYQPPVGGIPRTDLSDDVQASLSKADTALQEHQDLSSYATLAKVQEVAEGLVTKDAHTSDIQGLQSAIEEVNAKIDMYKEATIDFGTGEDTVTMAVMESGTTITKVKMKNVKTLYLSYGNVTKAEYVGGEVPLGNADFLVMTIIRTAGDVDAVVGLTLR